MVLTTGVAVLLVCAFSAVHGQSNTELNPTDCLVWGPGLDAEVVLPVRYFFIQAVDSSQQNFTDSLGARAFSVQLSDPEDRKTRVHAKLEVLDRHDGSYIVRFRLYRSLKSLNIVVLSGGQHVAASPYSLEGPVYHEQCNCPMENTDTWLKSLKCRKHYQQIEDDLSIFKDIDLEVNAKETIKRFHEKGRKTLAHYKIIDNQIYRKIYGIHSDFKAYSDPILLSITRKVKLPDLEFFINFGDWPLERRKQGENPLPIFSWCGSDDASDIVMPTYDITDSTLETQRGKTLEMLSVQANTGPKWENKSSKAFFRGRDSRQERLDLMIMSREHPDIIDAVLTNMFFFPKDEEKYGKVIRRISFFDFFKHKYQISIDGTVAAYRLPYLLAGDSVVFKQESPYYESFYKELTPFVHYIPFARNLSDLMEKIEWAKVNDAKAQQIAKNAQQYVRENLLGKDVFCYHVALYKEYAKLLKNKPVFDEAFELVEQPSDRESHCDCLRENAKKGKDEL